MSGMDKNKIRKQMLEKRDALDAEARRRGAVLITERILGHQWFYRAERILGFMPFGSEIDIREILQESLRLGKELYLPRICGERGNRWMQFFRVRSLEELQPGFHGILEPAENGEPYEPYEPAALEGAPEDGDHIPGVRELLLMPGVAFDLYKNRIGYGGGFYDRFLEQYPQFQIYSIAVGHACQLWEEALPVEEKDVRPYQVIVV